MPYGVQRGGARAGQHQVRPLGPGIDGHLAGSHVGNQHGDKKGRNPGWPGFHKFGMEYFDSVQPAKPDAKNDAGIFSIVFINAVSGILHQLLSTANGKLDETIHAPAEFCGNDFFRLKALYFPGNMRVITGSIEKGDAINPGFSRQQGFPTARGVKTQRGDGGNAGDDDTSAFHICSLLTLPGHAPERDVSPKESGRPHRRGCFAHRLFSGCRSPAKRGSAVPRAYFCLLSI